MFDEVIACLDGSPLAEKIIPLARALTLAARGKLVLLRVVQDEAGISAEEDYLRDCARRHGAQLRIVISPDPARAISAELLRQSRAVPALTTHGRTAWAEAIMGSNALRILREAKRPVVLFRAQEESRQAPEKITTVATALDGSAFSEKILPYAVKAARALSARLLLLQALPVHSAKTPLSESDQGAVSEAAYLHRKAAEIRSAHAVEVQWDVLHGKAADALCGYLKDMPETLLAMTTHARAEALRLVMGSVAGSCVRNAGVPLLLYWPPDER